MRYFIKKENETEELCGCGAILYYTPGDLHNVGTEEINRTFPPDIGKLRIDKETVGYLTCPNCKKEIRILLDFERG